MRSGFQIRGHSQKSESGSVSIEFALIAIGLMVGTLGLIDMGRILFSYHNLAAAVGGTTRLVQMRAPENAIMNSINSHFSPSEQRQLTIEINSNVIINGVIYTRIDARYPLPLITPNLGIFSGSSFMLRASQLVPTS